MKFLLPPFPKGLVNDKKAEKAGLLDLSYPVEYEERMKHISCQDFPTFTSLPPFVATQPSTGCTN